MNFTSLEFVLFFAMILAVRSCLRCSNADKWFLLAVSIAFYMTWSVPCVLLILFTSLSDYTIGRQMARTSEARPRLHLLWASLAINLGLLAFFKYSGFILQNISAALGLLGWHVDIHNVNIVLPPAISFFTFASMTYMLDLYYERIPVCQSARDYTLFITFFPKLLSGPIVRAREFLPQLKERLRVTIEDVEIGLAYVMIGAVKKLVIADQIAPHVNLIFSTPRQFDGLTLLTGAVGYTVQLYCDFSGYSDMAIGCARLLGFGLPDNFRMPYSSASITEFWRRWHITLSHWFRDYLFLPLEMATRRNPSPTLRVSLNMTVTMLLCGLWHGPSWTFVIWGGIHGAALAIHKVWRDSGLQNKLRKVCPSHAISGFAAHGLTLAVVVLSMVFFRAPSVSDAASYLSRLLLWSHSGTRMVSPYILAAVGSVLLVHLLINKDRNLAVELPRMSLVPRVVGYSSLLLALVVFGATDSAAFIYFRF
jgi:alginate O-acetyltransferase complex protein AlgI